MPRIRKNEFYDVKKSFTIFVFWDQIYDEFFVWKTNNSNLKKVFEVHYQLRNACTRGMFERGKSIGTTPKMYLLDTIEETEAVAFKHCIAWTKFFMMCGFESKNYESHKGYAAYLDDVSQQIYDNIKDREVADVCNESTQLFADYGTHRRKNNEVSEYKKITFTLPREQYEKVAVNAKELSLTPAAYAKKMTLEGEIKRENYDFFLDYIVALSKIERCLRGIQKTVYETGKFLPADMQNIENLCVQATELHREQAKVFQKRRRRKRTRK